MIEKILISDNFLNYLINNNILEIKKSDKASQLVNLNFVKFYNITI
jgi:hypothetical protein